MTEAQAEQLLRIKIDLDEVNRLYDYSIALQAKLIAAQDFVLICQKTLMDAGLPLPPRPAEMKISLGPIPRPISEA
jgi:hypothetical protein